MNVYHDGATLIAIIEGENRIKVAKISATDTVVEIYSLRKLSSLTSAYSHLKPAMLTTKEIDLIYGEVSNVLIAAVVDSCGNRALANEMFQMLKHRIVEAQISQPGVELDGIEVSELAKELKELEEHTQSRRASDKLLAAAASAIANSVKK